MSDTLLMGTARPLFRYVSGSYVYRYILNDKPTQIQIPLPFPEEEIVNPGVFSPYSLWKTSKGFRMSCLVTFDQLDRPSVEKFLEIAESGNSFYMRPHFNFYKEYEVLCLNARSALQRIGIVTNPYQGALYFTGKENITTHPISQGAFNFNGGNTITRTLSSAITGDMGIDMWIKTPSSFGAGQTLFKANSTGVDWIVSILADGTLRFRTDDGSTHDLDSSSGALETGKWYYIQVQRASTDAKHLRIDNVVVTDTDSKAANNISDIELGVNSFTGDAQILRLFNASIYSDWQALSIEAIPYDLVSDLKLWWDFSQGNANDLENSENGTITGTEAYTKESFPDNGKTVLT